MDQRLKALSKKRSALSSLLFIQEGGRDLRVERLFGWASLINEGTVTEARGSALLLTPKDELFQSSIKVDDVRALLEKLSLSVWDSESYRYVLIPYAEKLGASSSNALLKAIEEPPEKTIFLLMSSSRQQVLKTLLSRSMLVSMPSLLGKDTEETGTLSENPFFQAIYRSDVTALKKLKKNEASKSFEAFYNSTLKSVYLDKVKNPQKHIELIEGVGRRLHHHMDIKWVASYILRYA